MRFLGNSYVVLAELPVHWLPSASQIPKLQEGADAAIYPVWLMDATGVRAHIFMRCPACDAPLNLSPSSMREQRGWNESPPDIQLITGCLRCSGTYMIDEEKAYCLSLTPAHTARKVAVAKPQ
ncbi:hypothetical protein LCGC14_3061390 [marine sediment metagenome]|uniref:Uncharacterized protein n=1 Tax=marine sediment metagenome TaxID=412755 RepID=A0A0F8Z9I1_9ZZZZ